MKKQELIEKYLHKFNLDTRASENELDIAYEVLTSKKNVKLEEIREYREAFEYLKTNFYKSIKVEDYQLENDMQICIENMPEPIQNAFDYIEKNGTSLQDASKIIWSTQIVNYSMLLKNLLEKQKNFLGFRFWTYKDILDILDKSCLNKVKYRTVSIEMSDYTCSVTSEIKSFAHSLQKIFLKDILCNTFELEETICGVCIYAVLSNDLEEHLSRLVEKKARNLKCSLNLLTTKDKEE